MKLKFRQTLSLAKTAFKEWWSKDPFRESAVIAYYAIFSLPGLLVLITTVAGFIIGSNAINNHIENEMASTFGANTAHQIQVMISLASESKNSVLAAIIGGITILIGATAVFAQFQKSLNIIWEVKTDKSKAGIWNLIKVRLFSFGLIVSIAFILIVSLIVSSALAALGKWLSSNFPDSLLVAIQVVNFILSIAILSFLFALMFKIFPDAQIKWSHVWTGSVVTAILFELGKFALSLYFGKADPGSRYGAAGSIILILLWVSYSSMLVFYGAEFTRAYALQHDDWIPPNQIAKKQQGRKI